MFDIEIKNLSIPAIQTIMTQAIDKVKSLEFDENDINDYKDNISNARTLKNNINDYRINLERKQLELINKEISLLKDFTKELDNVIINVDSDYKSYISAQKKIRVLEAEKDFNTLINDYQAPITFDDIFDKKFENKTLSKVKRRELIIENVTRLDNIYQSCTDKELIVRVKYDLEEYERIKTLTTKEEVVTNDDNVTIVINRSYLKKLNQLNIKYKEV